MNTRGGLQMLKIALSKGVLYEPSIDILKRSGFDTEDLENPGRRLLVTSSDNISYILSRPGDVPTYVEYGAADLGFAGKDALVESEVDVFELLDLKIGKCTFILAELKKDIERKQRSYQQLGQLRVATKYPKIASDYLNRKGIQAEIITLRGSIELAPLTGLADMIIDLTSTGRTLKENGLEVIDEVIECSARLISNSVSNRIKSERIEDFIDKLKI